MREILAINPHASLMYAEGVFLHVDSHSCGRSSTNHIDRSVSSSRDWEQSRADRLTGLMQS